MPVAFTYALKFTANSGDEPLVVDIVRGDGNDCPDEAIRYRDLQLPKESTALLAISASGIDDLRYDNRGNGLFLSTMKPTAHVLAPAAWDIEGPSIEISESPKDANALLITIKARDESGVSKLYYFVDGGRVVRYEKPFEADRAKAHLITAIADDNAGNRSQPYTFRTKP
jgi:hypothetical protein